MKTNSKKTTESKFEVGCVYCGLGEPYFKVLSRTEKTITIFNYKYLTTEKKRVFNENGEYVVLPNTGVYSISAENKKEEAQETIRNIQVKKEDIRLIGGATLNVNGNTAFVCDASTCGLEEILLRNILKCFGEDMEIVVTKEDWNDDCAKLIYITNLPFETYSEIEE